MGAPPVTAPLPETERASGLRREISVSRPSAPLVYFYAVMIYFRLQLAEALPPATLEKIGEELLLHVEKIEHLRAELDKEISSLDRGEGRPLEINDVIRRARSRYGKT
jgi:hypothetical protein